MSYRFEATADLLVSLKSIDILRGFAKKEGDEGNNENRVLFLKLCVVYAVTRFQVFVENILDGFLYEIKLSKKKNKELPVHSRLSSIKILSSSYSLSKSLQNPENYQQDKLLGITQHISDLQELCENDKEVSAKFQIETKFPIGKTGTTELVSLFQQIEGKDIFTEPNIDIKKLDSILNIRCNIIHQDVNIQLTEVQIQDYKEYIEKLGLYIENYLSSVLIA